MSTGWTLKIQTRTQLAKLIAKSEFEPETVGFEKPQPNPKPIRKPKFEMKHGNSTQSPKAIILLYKILKHTLFESKFLGHKSKFLYIIQQKDRLGLGSVRIRIQVWIWVHVFVSLYLIKSTPTQHQLKLTLFGFGVRISIFIYIPR